ncbi:MAG TPA: hypothetical protein VMD53_18185 [Rhizomicrobium sp.]|nr:hypothetical protein [Rhizomicrobium sp.]
MKSTLHAALILAVSGTAAMTVAAPASAQVGVSFHVGDVAMAYRDGYWDNHHVWHAWQRDFDWKNFRDAHPERYHDYNHDRDDHVH